MTKENKILTYQIAFITIKQELIHFLNQDVKYASFSWAELHLAEG